MVKPRSALSTLMHFVLGYPLSLVRALVAGMLVIV